MPSLRQIRGRIKSIQSSQQIMRAMQMVSGSKLKRSQDRLLQARAVLEFLDGMLARVLASTASQGGASPERSRGTTESSDHPPARLSARRADIRRRRKNGWGGHPLYQVKEGGSTVVVFTSDAGLCGSYNTNLIQLAESQLRRDSARQTQLIFIGKRAWRYFTKRGYTAAEAYVDLAGRPNPAKADEIGRALMERFLTGQTASIGLLYSKFMSPTVYRPTITQWLPITLTPHPSPARHAIREPGRAPITSNDEYIFEPSAERVFEELLPRWALAKFSLTMLEAFTSEHSARMIAMKNATDNAQELLGALMMQRNKIRQAAITKELSEIVGTSEALK